MKMLTAQALSSLPFLQLVGFVSTSIEIHLAAGNEIVYEAGLLIKDLYRFRSEYGPQAANRYCGELQYQLDRFMLTKNLTQSNLEARGNVLLQFGMKS